ncbi:MAG TPA: NAD-dependent epimerase/dehydratase family protein, partial [Magnetospirillum sp.]|nr:NAD-dependent epimerase/dehydratase family protein [Magnetospirillum sp.]
MSSNVISDAPPFARRVLVTGGAGFVGRRLAALLARDRQVTVVDDLSAGLPMPEAGGNLACHVGDIRDPAAMAALMADVSPQAVIHLAALHHIPSCENDPRRAMDINVVGFQTVLDACARAGCGRVVLASSGAVYDWGDGGALDENASIRPCDVYSVTKATNEQQLALWAARTGGSGTIARLFNLIGPNDPNGHLIPDILGRLSSAGAAPVRLRLGNLETRRDFVDVNDAAEAFAALLDRAPWRPAGTDTFNICSGREYTVPDIALKLAG